MLTVSKMNPDQSKVWISPDGISHVGEYHTEVALGLFPHAENPEYACEKAGYLKVYILEYCRSVRAMLTGCETQAQINELDRLTEQYYEHSKT